MWSQALANGGYLLRPEEGDTPFFHHVAALAELYQAAQEDRLFTHHFNMLRTILEDGEFPRPQNFRFASSKTMTTRTAFCMRA
ncbi:hypothetical protein BANRA_05392 [Escherichia coli]|nr:hypothetical protein [Escherichia coli]VCW49646.1 hypothetical protein BANRA_05392 [Escherichia coli]